MAKVAALRTYHLAQGDQCRQSPDSWLNSHTLCPREPNSMPYGQGIFATLAIRGTITNHTIAAPSPDPSVLLTKDIAPLKRHKFALIPNAQGTQTNK